jgi:hypothetical protein
LYDFRADINRDLCLTAVNDEERLAFISLSDDALS